ncbi:MAG: LCP family protein [Ktedonobacteraceae bacterium]|nr:LCP family protein [Ktedonobacteraceae bacterium]
MKRQFMHIQPSQRNRPPVQPPTGKEQAEETFPQGPSAHPVSSPPPSRMAGKGLLSGWKTSNRGQTADQPTSPTAPFGNPGSNNVAQPGPHQSGGPFMQPQQPQQWSNTPQQRRQPMPGPPNFGSGAPLIPQATSQAPSRTSRQSGPLSHPAVPPLVQQGMSMPGMSSNQFSSNESPAGRRYQSGSLTGFEQNKAAYFNQATVATPPAPSWKIPEPPDGQKPKGRGRKKRRFPIWARVMLGILIFFIITGGSAYAYYQINYAPALNNITGKKAIHGNKTGDNTNQSNNTDNSNNVLTGKRINILLLGSDNDGKNGNDKYPLAQTDIIVTVDPTTKYVGMLSIPRDMQVTDNIYGGAYKLDEIFSYGAQHAKANAPVSDIISTAAGHAMDVIEYNYGIHIDHYAWVGLDGFVKVIDTAGGVDIDALHPMVDDDYPDDVNNKTTDKHAYKRLYIAPGPQHMNGVQALEYVRTRHSDLIGDFGRSARQQQVLNQLKIKLATPAVIGKANELLKDLNGAVQTDLDVNQIVQIANLARQIDSNKIERITLSPPDYSYAGLPRGNFGPRCDAVKAAINKMFGIQTANCVPQQGSTGTSGVANASGQPGNIAQQADDAPLTQVSSSTELQPNDNFASVHSLLDLMFMPVFETFEAGKV